MEQEAADAQDRRDLYADMLTATMSEEPAKNVETLAELLRVICGWRGRAALWPSAIRELRVRAQDLFDSVLCAALPEVREGTRLPEPDIVDALVHEADRLLSRTRWAVVREGPKEQSVNAIMAKTAELLSTLIGYWVECRLSVDMTVREIDERKKACAAALGKARHGRPKENALEMVAALLDTSAGMVRKLRKQASRRKGKRTEDAAKR